MTVRRARPSDRAAAVALWTRLHREHEGQDVRYRLSDDAAGRWATDFATWARSEADRVWLAEAAGGGPDDSPVGLLTAHLYAPAPTFQPTVMVWVDDLYVAPEARGAGVAGLLLDAARGWAATNGATEIRAGVLAANPAGRAFWERQGAADFSVVVAIQLP